MIRLRRDLDGVSAGLLGAHVAITHDNEQPGNAVLVMRRWRTPGDDVMVVMNFGAKSYARYDIGLPSGGPWQVRVDSASVRYSPDFDHPTPTPITVTAQPRDGLAYMGSLSLGPSSIVVLSR
jgi:1,4-alpha-glucan branching enzyme